jgi:phosphoglycolate phosphatase
MSAEPAFDAVLFDLDGTLADSAEDIRAALELAFAELEIEVDAGLDGLVDGSPLEEVFAVAVPDGTEALLARFIDAYRRHYERSPTHRTRLYPGVRETLDTLRSMRPRLRLAVATTKRASTAQSVIHALGLGTTFELVAGSGATTLRPKPAPDLLLHVSEQLGVAPQRALMVGDTLRDVVAAQRAGMRVAAVTYGLGPVDALMDARPDYLLEEFDELLTVLGFEG